MNSIRPRSLFVYHLHMGGPDADALEWQALMSPRFEPRLRQMGVTFLQSVVEADVVVLTGLLTTQNLDSVVAQLALMPSPSVLIAAGDCAINGGQWAKLGMHALSPHPLGHYADIHISVPGDPVTPHALIAALVAAAELLSRPAENLGQWEE